MVKIHQQLYNKRTKNMKSRYIIRMLIAFLCMLTFSALPANARKIDYLSSPQQMTVCAKSTLNVRKAPARKSKVVGKLTRGEMVTKIGTCGKWAVINYNGKEYYVSGNYLKPVPSSEGVLNEVLSSSSNGHKMWMFWIVLGVVVAFFVCRDHMDENMGLWIINVGLWIISLLMIYYFKTQTDPMWFMYPSNVGWMWTIANYVIFTVVASIVLMIAYLLLIDRFSKNYTDSFFYGLLCTALLATCGYAIYIIVKVAWIQVLIVMVLVFALIGNHEGSSSGTNSASSSSSDCDPLDFASPSHTSSDSYGSRQTSNFGSREYDDDEYPDIDNDDDECEVSHRSHDMSEYNRLVSDANDARNRYEDYISKARNAMDNADIYERSADDHDRMADDYDDDTHRREAQSDRNMAESFRRDAREYEREAEYYKTQYEQLCQEAEYKKNY